MSGERNPRRRGDDGRRAELIQAASRVLSREGFAAATTRRIAEEAGVPTGLVHYWFSGKDELLEAVLADALGALESAAAQVGAEPGAEPVGLFERLRAAFGTIEQDDPGRQIALYEMTTWALRRPELRELARTQYTRYRELATSAAADWLQATGRRFPGGVEALGSFVSALFDGLALAWLADPEGTDVDAVLRLTSDLIESRVPAPS